MKPPSKPSFSDWEAELVLQTLERKQRVEKILAKPAGPRAFVLIFVVGATTFWFGTSLTGSVITLADYAAHADRVLFAWVVAPLGGLVAGLWLEVWSSRRRLEAAIELLKIHNQPNGTDL